MTWADRSKIVVESGPSLGDTVVKSHTGSLVAIGGHRFGLTHRKHGPFVSLKIWFTETSATPRAGVLLTENQVDELIAALDSWKNKNAFRN